MRNKYDKITERWVYSSIFFTILFVFAVQFWSFLFLGIASAGLAVCYNIKAQIEESKSQRR